MRTAPRLKALVEIDLLSHRQIPFGDEGVGVVVPTTTGKLAGVDGVDLSDSAVVGWAHGGAVDDIEAEARRLAGENSEGLLAGPRVGADEISEFPTG